jgi:hypothetical protein
MTKLKDYIGKTFKGFKFEDKKHSGPMPEMVI